MGRIWARERGKMPLREHSENIPVIHGENWGLSHMGKNSNRMGVRSREEHISTLYFFCPCSGVVAPRAMAHLFFYYSWWRDSGGIDACVCAPNPLTACTFDLEHFRASRCPRAKHAAACSSLRSSSSAARSLRRWSSAPRPWWTLRTLCSSSARRSR